MTSCENHVKTWKSFAEQLAILQQRGMAVSDEAKALDYLERLGYYRLSGYWYPMRQIDKAASHEAGRVIRRDTFEAGSRFGDVVHLYVFDKKLRLLALDALERIEMAVRVDVAHLLGERDPCAHETPKCLHGNFAKKAIRNGHNQGKTHHEVWLEKHRTLVYRARRKPFIAHHHERYNGRLPIWVAIEVWDFGQLSKLFAGMKHADQNTIAQKYGITDGKTLQKWLRSLNFIRNTSAHHSRIWNINVLELSPPPSHWNGINNARPFMYFCVMQQLLGVICPNSTWGTRFKALLEEFPSTKGPLLDLRDFGLVDGWQDWNVWRELE